MTDLSDIGLDAATKVYAAEPNPDGGITPPPFVPAVGISFHWANTTVLGDLDVDGLRRKITDGWTFVTPGADSPFTMTLGQAVARQGFCLMSRSTASVQAQRAQERAKHMDLDGRVINIMARYTGEAPTVSIGGLQLQISVTKPRPFDDDDDDYGPVTEPPITTPDELRAELAKRGFPEADIALFMQRHFGA